MRALRSVAIVAANTHRHLRRKEIRGRSACSIPDTGAHRVSLNTGNKLLATLSWPDNL